MNILHTLHTQNSITLFFTFFYALIFLVLILLSIGTLRAQKRKKNGENKKEPALPPIKISSKDIVAIAGEDKLATQLDLARAYIETGRKQLAKKILADVAQRGDALLQAEAQRLMQLL